MGCRPSYAPEQPKTVIVLQQPIAVQPLQGSGPALVEGPAHIGHTVTVTTMGWMLTDIPDSSSRTPCRLVPAFKGSNEKLACRSLVFPGKSRAGRMDDLGQAADVGKSLAMMSLYST